MVLVLAEIFSLKVVLNLVQGVTITNTAQAR